jgi:hypothetical protein
MEAKERAAGLGAELGEFQAGISELKRQKKAACDQMLIP